jgi:Phage integrase family
VASLLTQWLKKKPAHQRLWPGGWVNHAAKMVRADLSAARAAWIQAATTPQQRSERQASAVLVYRDDRDRVFDFHSLRHQYISNLASAGVHPKVAQTLARHSTISLTMDRYTHTQLIDLTDSVNCLPSISSEIPEAEAKALRATGTENASGSEVPTVVPRGAENGAVLPASTLLRVAPDCTERPKREGNRRRRNSANE